MTVSCQHCGAPFVAPAYSLRPGRSPKFCGRSCAGKARIGVATAAQTPEARQARARRMGLARAIAKRAAGLTRLAPPSPCAWCGTSFQPLRSNVKRGAGRCCSRECNRLLITNGRPKPQPLPPGFAARFPQLRTLSMATGLHLVLPEHSRGIASEQPGESAVAR